MNTDSAAIVENSENTETAPAATQPLHDPRELLLKLQEISPTFRDCKPVALRIDKSVMALFPDIDRKVIRSAMRLHTTSTRYLKALQRETHRYDLEGNPCEEIAQEHREHAAQTLKTRFTEAARRKREKEKEEAQRQRETVAEQRRADKLQQLVGRFSKR